jgi:hypothetical protein
MNRQMYCESFCWRFRMLKIFEEEHLTESGNPSGIETSYQRIKQLLDDAKDQNLFKDINDPSQWQRELRKEWG